MCLIWVLVDSVVLSIGLGDLFFLLISILSILIANCFVVIAIYFLSKFNISLN